MPTIAPNTPTVSVQVPVPTPVQTKPKPQRAPVSFGGESVPQLPAPGPTGVPAQPVQPPQLNSVILPWSPPPKRMKRLPVKVAKYARAIDISRDYNETPHAALSRFLGGRNQRRHGRSVTVFRTDNGDIAVRLYDTNVVTAHPNGQVTLNHGGYMTPTTRRFMGYANPVIRNVSFAGGRFMIHTGSGWQEYENNTKFPPAPEENKIVPVPERGRLTPEQAKLLHAHMETGELTPLGMLGDSLTEGGYPHTGELISRLATGDPGTGSTHIGEHHPQYQQTPVLGQYDFHFVPGRGDHDLHELHISTVAANDGSPGQFRVVGSKPAPEKMSRLPRKKVTVKRK